MGLRALTPLLALCLGLLTTLAIAIWASLHATIGPATFNAAATAPSGNAWHFSVITGRMRDACNVTFKQSPIAAPLDPAEFDSIPMTTLPHGAWRSGVRSAAATPGLAFGFWNMQAYGWPRRCLMGGFAKCTPGTQVNLGWWDNPLGLKATSLPIRPIWPGLIVNTGLFGTAWFALLGLLSLAAKALRHRRRIRRGHCPRCTYDLRSEFSSGCPECGWNRAPPKT